MGKKLVIALGVLVVAGGIALLTVEQWLPALLLKPNHAFADQSPPQPLDYTKAESWSAWPGVEDASDELPPQIIPLPEAVRKAAVFYVYPTINMDKAHWNQNLDNPSQRLLADQLPVKSQASAFQGCCTVYAPYYRQATMYSYFSKGADGVAAMDLAYQDVARAFDHFLSVIGDQPIVLASHSQGTTHLERLLQDKVQGALADRIVAVYAIGYRTPLELLDANAIPFGVCDSPAQTGCLIHWDTFLDGAPPLEHNQAGPGHWMGDGYRYASAPDQMVCVNPLSWRADEQQVPADQHKGGIDFDTSAFAGVWTGQTPQPGAVSTLNGLMPNVTYARCDSGRLMVDRAKEPMFEGTMSPGDSLHLADMGLFWLDIYENAIVRVNAFTSGAD